MNKRNRFISSALEELSNDADVQSTSQEGVRIATPAAITEVDIDTSKDAVAELMDKNSELADSNATLENETFDNDLEAVEQSSDSVQQDLDDAVAAGVGLEQLAHLIEADLRAGTVSRGAVAGYAMALEQLSYRGGLTNPIPALEAEALQLEGPAGQANAIGEAAKSKAGELAKKLATGIQRIVGWLLGILRNFFSHAKGLEARAKKAYALLDSIDSTKTIESEVFITSMRMVEGAGDPMDQFEAYAKLASKTLYGFFNDSFVKDLCDVINRARNESHSDAEILSGVTGRVQEILKVLMSTIYTEHGTGADVSTHLPSDVNERDLTVGLTEPCLGGVQLYLAATINVARADDGKLLYCASGTVKTPPKIFHGSSIPAADPQRAKRMIGAIEGWMKSQIKLQNIFNSLKTATLIGKWTVPLEVIKVYMTLMNSLASGCVPHLLRLNMKNAASFLAYIEKSAAVSKGTAEAK